MSEQEKTMNREHPLLMAYASSFLDYSMCDRPFVVGGYLYATNGRVCIRTKVDAPDDAGTFPPVNKLQWDGPWAEPMPLPELPPIPEPVACTWCKGRGYLDCRGCDDCGGEGEVVCDECGYAHECETCDGAGRVHKRAACEVCGGTGTDDAEREPVWLEAGRVVVDAAHLRPLVGLGAVIHLPADETKRGRWPVLFRVGAFEGLIKPVAPKKPETVSAA